MIAYECIKFAMSSNCDHNDGILVWTVLILASFPTFFHHLLANFTEIHRYLFSLSNDRSTRLARECSDRAPR